MLATSRNETELRVLANLLAYPRMLFVVADFLYPEDFSAEVNAELYRVMCSDCCIESTDTTLIEAIRRWGKGELIGLDLVGKLDSLATEFSSEEEAEESIRRDCSRIVEMSGFTE